MNASEFEKRYGRDALSDAERLIADKLDRVAGWIEPRAADLGGDSGRHEYNSGMSSAAWMVREYAKDLREQLDGV